MPKARPQWVGTIDPSGGQHLFRVIRWELKRYLPEILCARALYSSLTQIFRFSLKIFQNEEKIKILKKVSF